MPKAKKPYTRQGMRLGMQLTLAVFVAGTLGLIVFAAVNAPDPAFVIAFLLMFLAFILVYSMTAFSIGQRGYTYDESGVLIAIDLNKNAAALIVLQKFRKRNQPIREITARGFALTEEMLRDIAAFPTLEVLDLRESTGISDAGLQNFSRLPALKNLLLVGASGWSTQAIEELEQANPACEVALQLHKGEAQQTVDNSYQWKLLALILFGILTAVAAGILFAMFGGDPP